MFKGWVKGVKEKLDMYDMLISNLIAGVAIIPPNKQLNNEQIYIGFSNISSESQISKYFLIRQFPDYIQPRIFDLIRSRSLNKGVKINFTVYADPHKIDWASPEMKNRMNIWKRYSEENSGVVDVFDYRSKRGDELARERIIKSTKYLNEAELDFKRNLMKATFMIEVSAKRDDASILNMMDTISDMRKLCSLYDIRIRELRTNMIDWGQALGIFSLANVRNVIGRVPKKVVSDDILSNFNSYKQGRVGKTGVSLGVDIDSGLLVMRKFKEDPDAADNWLIAAESGGGKSFFVKALITNLLADGFVVTVMDYEGDEYSNLASYIKAAEPKDVKIVSMGKGSTIYFDPMEVPSITGDIDIDRELKENAINYVVAMFKVIIGGVQAELTQVEERVLSLAIQRVYDAAGVTDNQKTWVRSKGLRLHMVYEEIKNMVITKELTDSDVDNVRHKAAVRIQDSSSIYFEDGEVRSGTFKNPMSVNELQAAKFIVFSFGMRGAGNSISDQTILALKQLSVACVSIQISNYCKYIKKCFNVKVWEEFQRWGDIKGSSEIILNAITGGRKRGDINFVVTNNLSSILRTDNDVSSGILQNIQNVAIGKIKDKSTRSKFCGVLDLKEIEPGLDKIAMANTSEDGGAFNRYRHSFCVVLDNGKRSILKVMIPRELGTSKLFKTGVDVVKGGI